MYEAWLHLEKEKPVRERCVMVRKPNKSFERSANSAALIENLRGFGVARAAAQFERSAAILSDEEETRLEMVRYEIQSSKRIV